MHRSVVVVPGRRSRRDACVVVERERKSSVCFSPPDVSAIVPPFGPQFLSLNLNPDPSSRAYETRTFQIAK